MHKNLPRIKAWKPAVLMGVGVAKPDLSHFEMQRRWWSGDQDSTHLTATGFLGRLCDHIGDKTAPAVGVSLGYGPSPSLNSARVVDPVHEPLQRRRVPALLGRGHGQRLEGRLEDHVRAAEQRDGALLLGARWCRVRAAVQRPGQGAAGQGDGYPNSELGVQLRLAARMLRQDNGIRIIHIPVFADFDTHDDHRNRHAEIMTMLDKAIDAFLKELMDTGHADEVLRRHDLRVRPARPGQRVQRPRPRGRLVRDAAGPGEPGPGG